MFNRVAIIGLGLIGGSLGLALRQAKAARQVAGFDITKGVGDRARKLGAIDQSCASLADAVRGSELIILATPVGAMRPLLQQLATSASPGAVVTDVASTKAQVISWAEEYLPATISFVGGHPIAGKEISGIEAADAALFKQCVYCLTPTKRTSPAALEKSRCAHRRARRARAFSGATRTRWLDGWRKPPALYSLHRSYADHRLKPGLGRRLDTGWQRFPRHDAPRRRQPRNVPRHLPDQQRNHHALARRLHRRP